MKYPLNIFLYKAYLPDWLEIQLFEIVAYFETVFTAINAKNQAYKDK